MCNYSKLFIQRLKELQNGESVSAFARRIEVKQQTLDACLKGQRKPSVEMVYTISCKLGVSSDWLLGLSNDRWPSNGAERDIELSKTRQKLGEIIMPIRSDTKRYHKAEGKARVEKHKPKRRTPK